MRIGIFGGSFNPPHKMHENICVYLLSNKILDKIIFVPTGLKYKYKTNLIANEYRADMLNIISKKYKNIEVSDFEFKENQVYTCETLDHFQNIYKDDQIYFICGYDNLSYMEEWKNGCYILNNYKILAIKRDSNKESEINKLMEKYKNNIEIVNMSLSSISSTYIRDNINKIDNSIIDEDVLKYILKNNLYNS